MRSSTWLAGQLDRAFICPVARAKTSMEICFCEVGKIFDDFGDAISDCEKSPELSCSIRSNLSGYAREEQHTRITIGAAGRFIPDDLARRYPYRGQPESILASVWRRVLKVLVREAGI